MAKNKVTLRFIFSLLIIALIIFFIVRTFCHHKPYAIPKCDKVPVHNVILVGICTLRADHFNCYGYPNNTTPNINDFCADAVLFKETISQAPSTAPSFAAMFTSLLPLHNGLSTDNETIISPDCVTIAELLSHNGYHTVSFNNGGQVTNDFGFDRGFDIFTKLKGKTILRAVEWLKSNKDKRFFLFIHSIEPHSPYMPSKEDAELFDKLYKGILAEDIVVLDKTKLKEDLLNASYADLQRIVNRYDAEIYSVDRQFGILIDYLKKEGLYENSMIIFAGDHGEEFGEHGYFARHAHTLYDELLKVPLIIKFPSSEYGSTVVTSQVRLIDILPTVLDVLEMPLPEYLEGISLLELLNGNPNRPLFAVSQKDCKARLKNSTIRTKYWKLNQGRLFDLEKDPLEKNDVSEKFPIIKRELQKKLDEILRQRKIAESKKVKLKKETVEQLKSLGYL
ncbi:MAG: sulfatase [Candidatus Omnitrophica bacterium]|nr:sulfatase [Candidatus Omnitrophota bacterium]